MMVGIVSHSYGTSALSSVGMNEIKDSEGVMTDLIAASLAYTTCIKHLLTDSVSLHIPHLS